MAFGRRQGSASMLVDDANAALPCASVLDSSFMLNTTKFLPETRSSGNSVDPDTAAWRKVGAFALCFN